jgi:hypothetical protein
VGRENCAGPWAWPGALVLSRGDDDGQARERDRDRDLGEFAILSPVLRPWLCIVLPTHNREPYDTLLYCPTACPYRSVCGTDAACSSNTIRDSISPCV